MKTCRDRSLVQRDGCGALLSIIKNLQGQIEDDMLVEVMDVAGPAMACHRHDEVVATKLLSLSLHLHLHPCHPLIQYLLGHPLHHARFRLYRYLLLIVILSSKFISCIATV